MNILILPPSLKQVFDLLKNGELDSFQIAEKLRLSPNVAAGRLQKLKTRGVIESNGVRAHLDSIKLGRSVVVWKIAVKRPPEVKPVNPRMTERITIGRQEMKKWY